MAAQKNRIFALNLGTQTITLAEFQTNPNGGVTLLRYKKEEILGDPAADATRVSQTRLQVESLAQEFGIKAPQKVNYAIASHVIFTRPVRLPSVGDASQVEQIVAFEAQQNVPYPIDQVVWDWQLLDEGHGGQMEVILAAIKSDLLDEINDGVRAAKFNAGVVEIAPMALYNALRYNYADAEGCTLLVDIGSRTTNLLFCEPGKIFPRRLNIGGSTITTALSKDLNVGFSEADQRKVDDGFVSLGGSYAEPDDAEIARISKIIRNQMTRLHQEIARSITFYRSEHGGNAPSRVLLAGGTASLAYMREFFQEKFAGMEVEYFNPLRNVSVANTLDLEQIGRDAHTLGEVIGLALRSAVSCPMELNLRPVSVVKAERIAGQRPFMIAAGVLVFAALASWWQYHARAAAETQKVAAELEGKAQPLKGVEGRINAARTEIEKLQEYAKPLVKTTRERDYWISVLNDLNARLPQEYIWITAFEPPNREELRKAAADAEREAQAAGAKPKKKKDEVAEAPPVIVMLRGIYLSQDAGNAAGPAVVDTFVSNLKESTFVEPVTDPEKGFSRNSPDTPEWGFKFTLPLKLKNPIDLQ
jgi:type IV pilus assembly protein PilM